MSRAKASGLNFAALACHTMRHAELSRTSRALALSLVARPQHRTRFCAREALAQPPLWRLSVAADEERNNVKTRDSRRPSRRRTPEELAQDHEDALRWRTKLRSEVGSPETSAPAIATSKTKSERSRFAAAIARAEFGRFYFKEMRPVRSAKPARGRNGKAD
jgi:hypothetical protein